MKANSEKRTANSGATIVPLAGCTAGGCVLNTSPVHAGLAYTGLKERIESEFEVGMPDTEVEQTLRRRVHPETQPPPSVRSRKRPPGARRSPPVDIDLHVRRADAVASRLASVGPTQPEARLGTVTYAGSSNDSRAHRRELVVLP